MNQTWGVDVYLYPYMIARLHACMVARLHDCVCYMHMCQMCEIMNVCGTCGYLNDMVLCLRI